MGPWTEDGSELEGLVVDAAAGDHDGWFALWSLLEPRLYGWVRKPTFIARLSQREDECRDIVVAVMGRLREKQFHRLKLYLAAREKDPHLSFSQWLRVVTKRVAIDYLRAHPDYLDRRRSAASGAPGSWVTTEILPADGHLSAGRPPMTNRVTVRQILRYASRALTKDQYRALELWANNVRSDEIARDLSLEHPVEAERMVRAALERLRRYFRKAQEEDDRQ